MGAKPAPREQMRVLFLTTMLPGLRRGGSEVASQAFVDALRGEGHDVTLLGYRRAGTDPPRAPGDVAVADRHIETRGAGLRPALWMARAVGTGQPYTFAKYTGRAYRRVVAAALAQSPPDLVVLDHAQVAWLDRADWGAPVVYLAHNVEHRVHEVADGARGPGAWAHRREHRLLAPLEQGLAARASEIWTLTAADAEALAALAGGRVRTRVFDLPPARVPDAPPAPSHDVVVLGSWRWRPNAAGLRWFVEHVVPELAPRGVEVVVGGADAAPILGARPGVRAVGAVPDALAFLQSGRVVAVPSVEGGGVQVKTLDAIASGRCVVATSTAMRGIANAPASVRVADAPAAFAEAAVAQGQASGAAGRTWAAARVSRFRGAVRAALRELRTAPA